MKIISDLLDTIQKFGFWVNELPLIGKITVTIIVLSFALLFMIMIWKPSQKAYNSLNDNGNSSSILSIEINPKSINTIVSEFKEELIKATDENNNKFLKNEYETQRLKEIITQLVEIEYGQDPLPWLLRGYQIESENWEQVKHSIQEVSLSISELLISIEEFSGDLISYDLDNYKRLYFGLKQRQEIFEQLLAIDKPDSSGDILLLCQSADSYDWLIKELKEIQKVLTSYLHNSDNKTTNNKEYDWEEKWTVREGLDEFISEMEFDNYHNRLYDFESNEKVKYFINFQSEEKARNAKKKIDQTEFSRKFNDKKNKLVKVYSDAKWLVFEIDAMDISPLAKKIKQ